MPTSRRQFLARLAAAGVGSAALAACSAPATTGAGRRPAGPSGGSAPSTGASPSTSPTSAQPSPAPVVHTDLVHGPRTTHQVALTFHGAGDPRLTRRVLAEAKAAQASLTVMAVGNWLDANPDLATAILDGGHELGNHTWSHQAMRQLSSAQARTEVQRAADVLHRLTGSHRRWFRPSGTPSSTATIRAAARAAGYERCLSYDVDPRDYQDPGSTVVIARLRQSVRAGSIVSLHLGHPGTVSALPNVFDLLRQKGLRAVTVSGLVGA